MTLSDLEKYKKALELIKSTSPLFTDFDSNICGDIEKAIKEIKKDVQ